MSIDTTPVSGAPEERGLSLQSDGTRASGRSRTATAAQVWRCAKAVPPLTSTPKLNIGPVVDFLPCIAVDHELAVCDRGTPELGPRRLLDGLRRPLETEMDWWLTRLDSEAFACAGRDETFLARTSVELTDGDVTGMVVSFMGLDEESGLPAILSCEGDAEPTVLHQVVGAVHVPSGYLVVTAPRAVVATPCPPVPDSAPGAALSELFCGLVGNFQVRLPGPGYLDIEVTYVLFDDVDHVHIAGFRAKYRGCDIAS